MGRPGRIARFGCALLASAATAAPAWAQTQAPSVFQHVDGNGVDLTDGSFNFSLTEASIGAGESRLAVVRTYGRAGWADGLPGRLRRSLYPTNNRISLGFGSRAEHFDRDSNGNWVPQRRDGATLSGSASSYTYTSADGTIVVYGAPGRSGFATYPSGGGTPYCVDDNDGECELVPLSVTRPNGRAMGLHWTVAEICGEPDAELRQPCRWFPRLVSLTNESSYLAKFRYALDSYTSAGPAPDWFRRTSARLVNTAVEACDPNALDCTGLTQSWPTIGYAQPSSGVTTVTNPANETWRFTESAGSFAIRRPGSGTDDIVATRDSTTGIVSQVAANGVTTNYTRSVSGSTATVTVTNALSQQTVIVSDLNVGRPISVTDPLGRTTGMQYDAFGRLKRTTAPEGNYTELTYDARGNVTQVQSVAKPGSGTATVTRSAAFPTTCTNGVTCNRPLSTTDALGNVTDYAYDPVHGGTLTVTAPAVAIGNASIRPQVRTTYTQIGGVHLPAQVSACQTSASCVGTADEVRTNATYGANLLPTSVSSGNGAGTLTATTGMTYDAVGNLLTVDGPLAGTLDTVRHRYDPARRPIGTVAPDPDASGPLPPRAVRTTYRSDGQISRVETGIVNGQSDADWAGMIVLEQVDTTFDANHRPSATSHSSGSIDRVVQTSYDALGRPDCVAQRMNPAAWTTLPASACTPQAAGTHGPDRISRAIRNAAGETIEVRTAVGTGLEAAEVRTEYSLNGRAIAVRDGEDNRTGYEYDGHDRLRRISFPLAAQGANAINAGDYEEVSYDAAGNVLTRRNRTGDTASYSYDALGRTIAKDLPGSEPDVVYGYDLLGRMTSASQTGHALTFTWDALGRRTVEAGPLGSVTQLFDAAGNREYLVHPDNVAFREFRDVVGRMTMIGEPYDATNDWIVTRYYYDLAGRRTTIVRGADLNGTATNHQYDAAGRLTTMGHDLDFYAGDLALGFAYNPAGQIVTNTRSNDAYSATPAPATTIETPNGLNQIVGRNSATLTYDGRGNLINDGAGTQYVYDSENRLLSRTDASGTVALAYDPLGRLYQLTSGATVRRFLYDGHTLISEHDGANLRLQRYVHGPGTDEPAAYYQGSAIGLAARTYPHQDERGSVVAIAHADGTLAGVNVYDEYGALQGTQTGRFGYTGQMWLPALGLSYSRARVYDPRLGRFLQTDPIGYGDGMNMYAYVSGDPVNATDPSGMCTLMSSTSYSEYQLLENGGARYLGEVEGPRFYSLGSDCWPGGGGIPINPWALNEDGGGGGEAAGATGSQSNASFCGNAARPNAAYSRAARSVFGTPAYDTPRETALLNQYFLGDTTPFRLRDTEMIRARQFVRNHPEAVGPATGRWPSDLRLVTRPVYFGLVGSSDRFLDALLGTATGLFDSSGELVGIRDTFNFDFKDRGGDYDTVGVNVGIAPFRIDAFVCSGDVRIPVTGGR